MVYKAIIGATCACVITSISLSVKAASVLGLQLKDVGSNMTICKGI